MIAVALGLIGLVVMIATGVAASSTGDDRLTFLGVGVQTTTAQVFLTGAIFGWVFVIALWLLRTGMHRSGQRCAQLAERRSRRASAWLGFGETEPEDDGWGGWDDWRARGRRDAEGALREGIAGRAGAARHGRGAPWRGDGGGDPAHRAVAGAPDQSGLLRGGDAPGPVAGRFPAIGVDGGAQRRQIGRGSGPVSGEDRGADGEHRSGESRQ